MAKRRYNLTKNGITNITSDLKELIKHMRSGKRGPAGSSMYDITFASIINSLKDLVDHKAKSHLDQIESVVEDAEKKLGEAKHEWEYKFSKEISEIVEGKKSKKRTQAIIDRLAESRKLLFKFDKIANVHKKLLEKNNGLAAAQMIAKINDFFREDQQKADRIISQLEEDVLMLEQIKESIEAQINTTLGSIEISRDHVQPLIDGLKKELDASKEMISQLFEEGAEIDIGDIEI